MKQWRKIAERLFFLKGVWLLLLVPLSAALLVLVFAGENVPEAVSYFTYVISFYTFTALCCSLPGIIRYWKTAADKNKYIIRYRKDIRWKVMLSLYSSVTVNALYALMQLILGLRHETIWYYTMAAYYLMLAVMRVYLLRYTRNYKPGEKRRREWERYRICGFILLGMNLILSVVVFYIVWQNRTFVHHRITTIAMAAYTFTTFTLAVSNLIRYRKYHSPVFSAAKIISFTAAMVSMLTLERTMLTVFAQETQPDFDWYMLCATGSLVVLTVLGMAIYMIRKSTKELRKQE